MQGTSTTVKVTGSTNDTIEFDLVDDVTIAGDLTVSVDATVNGTLNMTSGQINNLANGTANNDAVNLGQVQGLIAGVGLFKGGYNANTGLTTDLGAGNGSLDGASNIELDLGDFFAVTVAGTAFFTETLEPGDMIYANTDIEANSSPAISDYTVVIQDANVAGEGATDGATDKGVAGFNSAHFSVTSNGFVSADIYGGGSTLGIVPSGGASTTFLRGDGTWVTPANTQYSVATASTLGLVKLGSDTEQSVAGNTVSSTAGRSYKVQLNSSDQMLVNVPWSNTTYTADQGVDLNGTTFRADLISYTAQTVAANSASTTTSRTYPIQINSSDKLVVNVPWTDTTGAVTSVDESTANDELGIIVSPTTGDVKVGLDIKGTANLGAAPASNDEIIIYDTSTDTNKALTIANLQSAIDTSAGKNILLNSALSYIGKADAGGIRTFAINVADSNVFGSGSTAINVKCEVIDASTSGSTAGQTVFADVTRGVNAGGQTYGTASLNIAFVGTPADSAYRVLLTYVG